VSLAGYLDRPQIVTRPAADKIDLGEFDQWGEPLRDGITRVLAEDLARQLPGAKISTFPWRGPEAVRYQVLVDVTRFDGPAGGGPAPQAQRRAVDARTVNDPRAQTTRPSQPPASARDPPTLSTVSRPPRALTR